MSRPRILWKFKVDLPASHDNIRIGSVHFSVQASPLCAPPAPPCTQRAPPCSLLQAPAAPLQLPCSLCAAPRRRNRRPRRRDWVRWTQRAQAAGSDGVCSSLSCANLFQPILGCQNKISGTALSDRSWGAPLGELRNPPSASRDISRDEPLGRVWQIIFSSATSTGAHDNHKSTAFQFLQVSESESLN